MPTNLYDLSTTSIRADEALSLLLLSLSEDAAERRSPDHVNADLVDIQLRRAALALRRAI